MWIIKPSEVHGLTFGTARSLRPEKGTSGGSGGPDLQCVPPTDLSTPGRNYAQRANPEARQQVRAIGPQAMARVGL